ncbi:MAG: autotransporter-associated beta strand repeat-containing protein [Opitutaceae bacterium]|jgi:autotransporter-associated beta strand protein|nr:autotransporter-associated beta strand repeat-containing protein [Opitutaceae bacterium]
MKTPQKLYKRGLAIVSLLIAGISPLPAADFIWDSSPDGNWSDDTKWNSGSAPSGADAVIKTPNQYGSLLVNGNFSVAGFEVAPVSTWEIQAGTGTASLSIGTLAKSGSGILRFRNTSTNTLSLAIGTITLAANGGQLQLGQQNETLQLDQLAVTGTTTIGTNSTLVVNAKNATFDVIDIASGTNTSLSIYAYKGTSASPGSGGITARGITGGGRIYTLDAAYRYNTGTLTLDGMTNDTFSYAGRLLDTITTNTQGGIITLSLVKTGDGVQTLTHASNSYSGTTLIDGGTLVVNGGHTGGGQYTINGTGTLAGKGTITTANADVVVSGNGKLSPGDEGTGTLTLALGTGKLDLTQAGDSALAFTFGAIATSTAVSLTSGTIEIGTGNIDLDSFSFTFVEGFGTGDYTLLASTGSITGTLGANLTGILNGHEVSLALSGDNTSIILSVGSAIPEPGTFTLLAGACILALVTFLRGMPRR